VREVDVVVDPVGGSTMARSWPVLRAGGILVAIAEEPDGQGGRDDVRSEFFVVAPSGSQLTELARLTDANMLQPAVSAQFGLASLPDAFAAQRARHSPGKVVVLVG
jgi:NADPH:quinone reductase-like Zn-dependent oxidoreductase